MPQSGLSSLVRAIEYYFSQIALEARVGFGLRSRNEWARSRVVVIPGRFDGSAEPRPMAGGRFGAPKQKASVNPRELACWTREITFSIFAVDPSDVRNPDVQNAALEDLVEALQQAIWGAIDPTTPAGATPGTPPGMAAIEFGDSIVMVPPVEGAYGLELLQQATMLTPLYARTQAVAFPTISLSKIITGPGLQGTSASITSVSSGLVSVSGLGGLVTGEWLNQYLVMAGAAIGANNGTFPIVGITSQRALVLQNPSGVAPDPANGAISWRLDPTGA
jgi:hypothetical protein